MKTAITGAWVYIIVLIFMVILIAYVSITINYSRSFEYSSNLIKSIEQNDGLNSTSLQEINYYLHNNGHSVTGSCPDEYYGVSNGSVDKHPKGTNYDYCVRRTSITGDDGITKCYFDTVVYFSFSLPVLGDLFKFKIPGQTTGMRYLKDDAWGACS